MRTHVLRFATLAAALLTAGLTGSRASAQGGTIYYVGPWATATGGGTAVMTTMAADGGNKTPLGLGIFGPPSRALHNGRRWFVYTKPIAGSFYPDGAQRSEVFAFRDDYDSSLNNTPQTRVQLTGDPTLQPAVASVDWVPGDLYISFKGRRWSSPDPGATVIEGGLYTAPLAFGPDGNIIGPAAAPVATVPFALDASQWPAFDGYSWNPAGSRVVYAVPGALWIADLPTSSHTWLCGGGARTPQWSPDGTLIAFTTGTMSIATVKPDGSGLKVIVPRTTAWSFSSPYWSPTGSSIVYTGQANSGSPPNIDVFRATSKGGSRTNLTNTPAPLNEYVGTFAGAGWR